MKQKLRILLESFSYTKLKPKKELFRCHQKKKKKKTEKKMLALSKNYISSFFFFFSSSVLKELYIFLVMNHKRIMVCFMLYFWSTRFQNKAQNNHFKTKQKLFNENFEINFNSVYSLLTYKSMQRCNLLLKHKLNFCSHHVNPF